jgi:hypothetical protein
MGGFFTLFGRGGGGCDDHSGYAGMGQCEADVLKRVPVLRYLKDPVMHIGELDAQYPYGGQPGWFAFVVSAGQFAYWDALYNRWDFMKYPPVTAEMLLAGLGIDVHTVADGDTIRWDAATERFTAAAEPEASVDVKAGKIDLRARFVRRTGYGGLAFTGNNVFPHITPAGGHVCTVWFRSLDGGVITFPASASDSFDGKTWVCLNGDTQVAVPGGKWAEVTVVYTGFEYMAKALVGEF